MMNNETRVWIGKQAWDTFRNGASLPSDVMYDLGMMPFIDTMRTLAEKEDKSIILRMLRDPDWHTRYLAVNIARDIHDRELAEAIGSAWRDEPHFHTRFSMVCFLMNNGYASDATEEMISWLEENKSEFVRHFTMFYEAYPEGVWRAVCDRFKKLRYSGGYPIRLLALICLAELSPQAQRLELPGEIRSLVDDPSPIVRQLTQRLLRLTN
jgi:hypothetical protein